MYSVYANKYMADIEAGNPIVCEVDSNDDYTWHVVRARIARKKEDLPGSEELWIRSEDGKWIAQDWGIKIEEELDPDEAGFAPLPMAASAPLYGPTK
jgi:hypothetical protein